MIVFLQKNGLIQTLCVSVNQTAFVVYLIFCKPLTNNKE